MNETTLTPLEWGAGKSAVQSILSHLSDDEVVREFVHSAPHRKIVFLEEIKRREIKTFVIDLGCSYKEDEIKRFMEQLCSELSDDSISADYSHIEAMLKEENCMMEHFQKKTVILDSMPFHLKSDIPLLKKKTPKFYQELNNKQLNRNRHR